MESLQSILNGPNTLPFDVSLDLGRRRLREILTDETVDIPPSELLALWQKLLNTACNSTVTNKHLTAACNAVCVFLRYTCQSTYEHARNFGFSENAWFEAFEIVRKAFADGKNKAALQVLDTLVQILHENPSRQASEVVLRRIVSVMLDVIFVGKPVVRLKEACIVLSILLRRTQDLLPLDQYSEAISPRLESTFRRRCRDSKIHDTELDHLPDTWLSSLLLALLMAASVPESGAAAIKLFSTLCSKAERVDFSQNVGIASSVIEVFLRSNQEALEAFTVEVFPTVLNESSQYDKFLAQFDPAEDFTNSRLSLFLAILRVGRQKGFVNESDLSAIISNAVVVPNAAPGSKTMVDAGFRYILKYDTPTIRLQAFDLLTASNATTSPVPPNTVSCLISSFKYLHDDTDSEYRDQYISIARRLVRRLEQSYLSMQKRQSHLPGPKISEHDKYVTLLQEWNEFLCLELLPQASYQRHILALQVLHLTIPPSYNIGGKLLTKSSPAVLVHALLNLMFNAFDDVRSQAAAVLTKIASYEHELVSSSMKLLSLVERGQRMSANTNRADHADALGKIIMLNDFIECKSGSAESSAYDSQCHSTVNLNLLAKSITQHLTETSNLNPASKYALHGNMLGVAYTLRQSANQLVKLDSSLTEILLQICYRVWALVQADLCIDSPETSNDEVDQDDLQGPKDFLAYSWRALRDSSLLMQSLLDSQPADFHLYKSLGDLSLDQLTRLRHRGAFSTVAQTFHLCCQKSRNVTSESFQELNKAWLQAAFQEINDQSHKLTRRSAGLPSMFGALLDPSDPTQFLTCVQQLNKIAQLAPDQSGEVENNVVRLPQVHALNCLKDIMTNSRFRLITESLVVQMLNLAAQSMASDVWAIRNCGLMLFRATINRLTPDSSDFYDTQGARSDILGLETPLTVATNLLRSRSSTFNNPETVVQTEDNQSELVFAALDLLSHIPYHPKTRQTIEKLIKAQFSSRLWAVREHAARLKASRTSGDEDIHTIKMLLTNTQHISSNELHGRLLCCLYIYREYQAKLTLTEIEEKSEVISTTISEIVQPSHHTHLHPLIRAACLDLLNTVFISSLRVGADCTRIVKCSDFLRPTSPRLNETTGFFLLHRAIDLNQACTYIHKSTTGQVLPHIKEKYLDFATDVANDRDVALYVIESLAEGLGDACAILFLKLLVQITLTSKFPAVRALAMTGISRTSQEALSQLTDLELQQLLSTLDIRQAEDREGWNASIGLSASLLINCGHRQLIPDTSFWDTFVNALRLSQQDEVETPTRFQAAQATASISAYTFSQNRASTMQAEPYHTRLLVVLYDFLNDDDGEIRRIATEAVYEIIKLHHSLPHTVIGCAAAARDTFAKLILSGHAGPVSLTAIAYSKVMGLGACTGLDEVSNMMNFCHGNSVDNIVGKWLHSASDLFAEERQNLYVDDIAEVEIWSAIICADAFKALPETAVRCLSSWTIEGLKNLEIRLREDSHEVTGLSDISDRYGARFVHPLGLTYNSEILIVYVRVVTIAGLLRLHFRRSEERTKVLVDLQTAIEVQLHSLQTTCHRCLGHQRLLTAIDLALSNQ